MTPYEQLQQQLKSKQHTWLITGVAGFIGSHLLEALLNHNQIVIGIDNFATGYKKNLQKVLDSLSADQKSHFHFYEGDICSVTDCQKVMQKVEFVLHQAALGSVPRSIEEPALTHASNVTGFLNILIAAKEANVKRFVYASSSSVYGDAPESPKKEEKTGQLLSPYAASKYMDELYAKVFATCYGIETMGLRYFNVFGLRQDPHGAYAAVVPCWAHALANGEPIYINGDGETTRDFCYVANAVQANLLAAMTQNSEAINKVYNIAVGEQNSLNQLYHFMAENLGLAPPPKPIYRDFRAGDIRHSLADIGLARQLLGYQPQYDLRQGLGLFLGK